MFGPEPAQSSEIGCEYYNEGVCTMTNLEELRKTSGCESEKKDVCCFECSHFNKCPSRCRIRTYTRTLSSEEHKIQPAQIGNLLAGVVSGIVVAAIAAFILRVVTQFTGDFYFVFVALCGGIGGLGFGVVAKGNKMLRGLVGCVFGILAMLLGYYMIYTMPLDIGFTVITPAQVMSFSEFLSVFLEPLDYLFIFAGIVLAYFGGSGSLKT